MSFTPIAVEGYSESGNLRRFARHRIETLAYIDLGPGNGGVLIDVGEGGMAFQGIQPLDKDQILSINFKLPGSNSPLESTCQIAWLNDSGKGGGLRFIDLPEGTYSKIKEWSSRQTAPLGPMENTVVPRSPVETNDLKSSPAIHLVAVQGNDASAHEPVRDSTPSRVTSIAAPGADTSAGVTRGSADLAGTSELHNTSSETVRRKFRLTLLTRRLLVSFAIVAILGAMLFPFHTQIMRAFSAKPQVTGDLRLGLKLERSGADWLVSWNRNTDVLLKAVSGQLSITDGQNSKELNLDPGELRSGSIMYTPATDDVVVRLRVFSEISVQPVSESVRILAGAAPQPPPKTKTASAAPSGGTGRGTPTAVADYRTPSAGRFPKEPVAQNPTALAPPLATKVATALKTDPPTASVDSNAVDASAKGAMPRPTTISRTIDSTIAPVTPPMSPELAQKLAAMLPEMPPPVLSAREPAVSGSRLEPAQIISRKDPIYPSSAKSNGITGRVELQFTIGVDGNVHDVKVADGNPLLAHAAIEAVQAWHYKPARLAGTPVPSDASTIFVFAPK